MADQKPSSYVIFRQVASTDPDFPVVWVEIKTVPGRSQEEAIKAAADTNSPGTYTAVPARSWSPLTVKPKTVTTFELEAPTAVAAPAAEVAS